MAIPLLPQYAVGILAIRNFVTGADEIMCSKGRQSVILVLGRLIPNKRPTSMSSLTLPLALLAAFSVTACANTGTSVPYGTTVSTGAFRITDITVLRPHMLKVSKQSCTNLRSDDDGNLLCK